MGKKCTRIVLLALVLVMLTGMLAPVYAGAPAVLAEEEPTVSGTEEAAPAGPEEDASAGLEEPAAEKAPAEEGPTAAEPGEPASAEEAPAEEGPAAAEPEEPAAADETPAVNDMENDASKTLDGAEENPEEEAPQEIVSGEAENELAPDASAEPMPLAETGADGFIRGTEPDSDYWWKLDENGTLTIKGIRMADYRYSGHMLHPWDTTNLESIEKIVIQQGITNIGDYAFSGCSGLKSITIPNSVTSIGYYAFSGCSGLKSITIPNSVKSIGGFAFSGCSGLKSITIPNSVTSIGDFAFENCSGLKSITIPNSVTSIGDGTFKNCSGLKSITIPNSVTSIGDFAFDYCSNLIEVTLPIGLTSIGSFAFFACGLTELAIPEGVTSIGGDAFGYTQLTKVTLPSSLTSISDGLFYRCESLTEVTIPSSVTNIGNKVFDACVDLRKINVAKENPNYSSLQGILYNKAQTKIIEVPLGIQGAITIPKGVMGIEVSAFSGCYYLTEINVAKENPNYSSAQGILYDKGQTKVLLAPRGIQGAVVLPSSVTSINGSAFSYCRTLTEVTIPEGVTSIDSGTFYACNNLTNVTIPSSVTSIGREAFVDCWSLKELTLAENLTSIGVGAFISCWALEKLTLSESLTSVGRGAFSDCYNLKHVYYSGSEEQWNSVAIDSNNDPLTSATIHYGSTGPSGGESGGNKPVTPTPPPTPSGTDTSIRPIKMGFYSPIGDRVYEMNMDWGWDLFLNASSTAYDYRLAKIGLALSGAAERSQDAVERMLTTGGPQNIKGLGFESEMVVSANYGRKWYETGYPAVTFAHKSITLANGEKSHIIAIVIRGTQPELGDISVDVYSIFGAFTWSANNTYNMLQTYIDGCSRNTGEVNKDNVKFFVAGHSLGGAVSNILAKKLTDEYGAENVFTYTFAAPRSTSDLFGNNYHNINNILNAEDQVPVSLSTQLTRYGDDIWFSRLEYQPDIYARFYEITGRKDLQAVMKSWNPFNDIPFAGSRFLYGHAVENYMAYLLARGENENRPVNYFRLTFRCPVDVEIYVDDGTEEGLLVGRVTDNAVDDTITSGLYVYVEDDEKYVYLMYEGDYTIKLTGTDNGTMEYSVQEVELNSDAVIDEKTFKNVELTNGKQMTSEISLWDKGDETVSTEDKIDTPDVQLFVVDSNGTPQKEVLPDGKGTEVPVESPKAPWRKAAQGWQYLGADGKPLTGSNWIEALGHRYVFDDNGILQTGNATGDLLWKGNQYYLNPAKNLNDPSTCYCVINYTRRRDAGVTYYNQDGITYRGWVDGGNGKLLYQTVLRGKDGKELKDEAGFSTYIYVWGGQQIPEGRDPLDDKKTIPAGNYLFGEDGVLVTGKTGWYTIPGSSAIAGEYYLTGTDGHCALNTTIWDDAKGHRYLFGADGRKVSAGKDGRDVALTINGQYQTLYLAPDTDYVVCEYYRPRKDSKGGDLGLTYYNPDGITYRGWVDGGNGKRLYQTVMNIQGVGELYFIVWRAQYLPAGKDPVTKDPIPAGWYLFDDNGVLITKDGTYTYPDTKGVDHRYQVKDGKIVAIDGKTPTTPKGA